MRIIPLAFDSFSTRSVATFVETKDVNILIDPGISIAPIRYGIAPHPKEMKRLDKDWRKIKKYVRKADVLILTHFHYDHYRPDEPKIWKGKIALIKHPTEHINKSQTKRAAEFIPKIKDIVKKLEICDGNEFKFGKTKIKFSKPVFHGPAVRLGYVTEVFIDDGKMKFVHTSDVEGPPMKNQTDFIIKSNPNVLFCDGPLSYMLYRYGRRSLANSIKNMKKIIKKTDVKKFALDHHFLRDLKWKEKVADVIELGNVEGCKVYTAADFIGEKPVLLEANRKNLFKQKPAKRKVRLPEYLEQ